MGLGSVGDITESRQPRLRLGWQHESRVFDEVLQRDVNSEGCGGDLCIAITITITITIAILIAIAITVLVGTMARVMCVAE